MSDSRNAKVHYQSFIRKKSTKSLKQLKIITQQTKTFKNLNNIDIKPIIINIQKLHIHLFKTIRKVEKVSLVGSNRSLYSDTKKWNFFNKKKCKNIKTSICF